MIASVITSLCGKDKHQITASTNEHHDQNKYKVTERLNPFHGTRTSRMNGGI